MKSEFRIQVRLMSATGLLAVNAIKGNSDPYVAVSIRRTGELKSTSVCLNTVNPSWYHNLVFDAVRYSDVLDINLYDYNLYSKPVALGFLEVRVAQALSATEAFLSEAEYGGSAQRQAFPRPPSAWVFNQRRIYEDDLAMHDYTPSAPPASPPRELATAGLAHQKEFSISPNHHAYDPIPHRPSHPLTRFVPQLHGVDAIGGTLFAGTRFLDVANEEGSSSRSDSQHHLTYADSDMQRAMTRTYPINPQGNLNIIVVSGALLNLEVSAPRSYCKRFQIHKFSEQVGNFGKNQLHTQIGKTVGSVLKTTAEMAKPINSALNLLQPVYVAFQEHSTWKVEMRGVRDIFGARRQGWNTSYPAAQRIFEGKSAIMSRRIVQMQHAYMYGGASGIKPLVNARKDLMEITGNLLDAHDFLALMEFGIRRGKSRMFTYVLMPERLYIAETGAEFFRDMMSKHAMHSSASPEVVYAGELHFQKAHSNSSMPRFTLVLDNNSGTYAPRKGDLPLVEKVFRQNFRGLQVIALDFKDVRLAEYKQQIAATIPQMTQKLSLGPPRTP